MKIGIDARLWNESGVGRYIRNLVFELSVIDKDNDYVLFFRKEEFNQVEIRAKNFTKKLADIPWHTLSEQLKFPAVIAEEEVDIMHFPYFSVPIFYNRPFIVTIHDLILHHFPTGKASTLPRFVYSAKYFGYKLILQAAADKSSKIITVSSATKSEIRDHLQIRDEKIVVIHEGIAKLKASQKLENNIKKFSSFENGQYILYVGNAYPHKNLQLLIHAFLEARKTNETSQLILVGTRDYFYARLEKSFKDAVDANAIVFFGKATDDELALLYENAKATIVPSLMEGFGLPVLEAMSCGSLVIASNIPALKEIGGDVPIYFNSNSLDELETIIQEVLGKSSATYKERIEKGKALVKKYSWQKMAKETLKIYTQAAY